MKTGRVIYLDAVKLFTIYLVILGHVLMMMVGGYVVGSKLINFIYSFHMPLFMLMSGYFVSRRSTEKPLFSFLALKGRQLILPAVSCTIVCCIYLFMARGGGDYRAEIIGNSWFLKTLFVYYVLFYVLKHIRCSDWLLFVVSCLLLFVVPGCSTLQVNLLWPYFWGGYFLRKHHTLERLSSSRKVFTVFLLLYIVSYGIQLYWKIPNYVPVNINTLTSEWQHILLRYIVAFSGSITVILLFAMLDMTIHQNKCYQSIAKYGQYTLGIYVLQTILVANIFPDTLAWYVESEWLLDTVIGPVVSMGFLLLCLWLILVMSKNRVLNLLFFGGQYHKS